MFILKLFIFTVTQIFSVSGRMKKLNFATHADSTLRISKEYNVFHLRLHRQYLLKL